MNPIDFNGLDTAVHGPIRLGIMTALQVDGPLDFMTLKGRLGTADGSLNLHLGKLDECGYITSRKAFVELRPKTTYRITPEGRRALANYLASMKSLIEYLERGSTGGGEELPAEPEPQKEAEPEKKASGFGGLAENWSD